MTGRPGTSSRNGGAGGGFGFQVVDRPMTQQGLGGIKSGVQGTGRMVQDKTYFQSELRQKINMLTSEINKMSSEADIVNRENSNYATFEKRADALSEDLKDLQGQLGDLNTLVDKLHTDSDLADVERLTFQLKAKNQRESQVLDDIFLQRQQKENQVREIEKAIEDERRKAEAQINELEPSRRTLYFEMKEQNTQYSIDIQQRQVDLDNLSGTIASLQKEVRHDGSKLRALVAYEKLSELRSKKKEIEEALKAMGSETGPIEKNRLLEQVKEDNQETSAMERKIGELEEQSQRLKEALSQLEIELESGLGDKNSKYEELVKRDKDMQSFLDKFEERKADALHRNAQTEQSIVALLDRIKSLAKNEALPSKSEHRELQGDLKFKEREMKNSENTMDGLLIERDRRVQDLEKVNQLESKLHAELDHLRGKIQKLEDDTKRVSNIDSVKRDAEVMKKRNAIDKESLKLQRDTLRQYVQATAARHDGKRAQLHDNETFTQLGALEQRLKHQESNNYHLKDYISAKTVESDYRVVAADSLKLVDEINGQLGKILSLPPAR